MVPLPSSPSPSPSSSVEVSTSNTPPISPIKVKAGSSFKSFSYLEESQSFPSQPSPSSKEQRLPEDACLHSLMTTFMLQIREFSPATKSTLDYPFLQEWCQSSRKNITISKLSETCVFMERNSQAKRLWNLEWLMEFCLLEQFWRKLEKRLRSCQVMERISKTSRNWNQSFTKK